MLTGAQEPGIKRKLIEVCDDLAACLARKG